MYCRQSRGGDFGPDCFRRLADVIAGGGGGAAAAAATAAAAAATAAAAAATAAAADAAFGVAQARTEPRLLSQLSW